MTPMRSRTGLNGRARRAAFLYGLRGMYVALASMIGVPDLAADHIKYETVPPVTTPDPDGFFTAAFPSTCSDGTTTLPSGGYIKAGTSFWIDASTTATGTCRVIIWGIPSGTQVRAVVAIRNYIYWPGGSVTYHPFWGQSNPPSASHDTTNPGNGSASYQVVVGSTLGKADVTFKRTAKPPAATYQR